MTWRRADRTAKLYINGLEELEMVATANSILDFKNSGHTVYDIGYKREDGERAHGYFSDLMVFNLELSQSEIRSDLVISHPFYSFIWQIRLKEATSQYFESFLWRPKLKVLWNLKIMIC